MVHNMTPHRCNQEFTLCEENITDKDPMLRVKRSPRSLFGLGFAFMTLTTLMGKIPCLVGNPTIPKFVCDGFCIINTTHEIFVIKIRDKSCPLGVDDNSTK